MKNIDILQLNNDQVELLDILSKRIDDIHNESRELVYYLSENFSEATLLDIKANGLKLWELLINFFKKVERYVKEKLLGHVHGLNLKLINTTDGGKIEYYTKFNKFKELNFPRNATFKIVDVELAYNTLYGLLKQVDSNFNESSSTDYRVKNVNDSENIYKDIREKVILHNQPISQLNTYIYKINKFYQKSIDAVYDISKKAIKNAKNQPGKFTYKKYVTAKNVTNSILSINNLIRIDSEK